MSNLQDLITSLSADGFTAEEGQEIINAAGGDLQAISDASGVDMKDINAFISEYDLQLPTTNNSNDSAPLDLSNLTGLLSPNPTDVPQMSVSGSSIPSSSEKTNEDLADVGLQTYNTLNTIKNAQAAQNAYNAAQAAVAANTQAAAAGNTLAAQAAGGLANEAAAAKAAMFLPGLGLFATAINLMGIFDKKGSLEETPYTTDVAIDLMETAISDAQQQTTSSADPNIKDTEGVYGMDDMLMGDLQDSLKRLYAQKAEEDGAIPEGFARDEQGFLRDADTESYWILSDNGALMRTTPPLVPVPMPEITPTTSGGGGGGSASGGGGGSQSGGSDASSDAIGDWTYDADAGVFRQTGGTETIVPRDGSYEDGQSMSNEEMSEVFERWGELSEDNTAETPDDEDEFVDIITGGFGGDNTIDSLEDVIVELEAPTPTLDNGGMISNGTGGGEDPNYGAGDDGLSGDGGAGTGSGAGTGGGAGTGSGDSTGGSTGGGAGGDGTGGDTGQGSGDGEGDGSGTGTGTGSGDGSGDGSGASDGSGLLIGMLGKPDTPVTRAIFENDFDIDVRKSSLLNLARYLV